jgi:hypothetical protein
LIGSNTENRATPPSIRSAAIATLKGKIGSERKLVFCDLEEGAGGKRRFEHFGIIVTRLFDGN